jgi:glycosyltransferase involved in cell wall biosynthesis
MSFQSALSSQPFEAAPAEGAGPRTQSDAGPAPRISVVLAVYNGERYLKEAIESILGQTFANFEFLIIDDGSTDRTREIIRSYQDPRIRLVVNETNEGLTRTLNRGLRLARGEFIARQDADDISEQERFEKQVAFMDANPEVALLGTQCIVVDTEGKCLWNSRMPQTWTEIRWSMLFCNPFSHSSVMLRRGLLPAIGLYNEEYRYSQDYEFWSRIMRRHPVEILPDRLIRYRHHPQSMTSTYGSRTEEGRLLRLTAVGDLIRWSDAGVDERLARHEAMSALLREHTRRYDADALVPAVNDLFQLETAFCNAYGVRRDELKKRQAELRKIISTHLVTFAKDCHRSNTPAARKMLRRAIRLYWPAILKPRVWRTTFRLVVG